MPNFKKYINPARYSKDGKTVIANFGYLSLLQIASYLFPLITMPYLAGVIGAVGFGKIAFASAIVVWFQTITDWGFNYTATREIAKNKNDKEIVSDVFSRVFWARCLLMIMSFIILALLIVIIPKFRENAAIICVTALLIPGHIMFPSWFFQAVEQMKYTTILNIVCKSIFTIAVFIFVKKPEDYIIQPLLTTFGFIISGIIAMIIITKKWGVRLRKKTLSLVVGTIKEGSNIFLNTIMPNFYNSFSTIVLGFFGGSVANGLLDAGGKLVSLGQQFMQVFSVASFPYFSRKIDRHKLFARLCLSIALCGTLVLLIFAPIFIKILFTEEFTESVKVLRIMSLGLIFITLNNVYGTNYLIALGYDKLIKNITLVCSIIGFAMSIPLIYYFSYIGAALTITITRGLLGLSMFYFAKKQRT